MNKEIFIFPICESNHFKVIIWDNINRSIFEIDPLRKRTTDSKRLQNFIEYIKKTKISKLVPEIIIKSIAIQPNEWSCGYVCAIVLYFFIPKYLVEL